MPKRGRSHAIYPPAKRVARSSGRRSTFRRLAPRNQFINQLGGWSTNNRRSGTVNAVVTTPLNGFSVTVAATEYEGSANIAIPGNQLANTNMFDAFQRMRLKKTTMYMSMRTAVNVPSTTRNVQISVCKNRAGATGLDAKNVQNNQTKIMALGSTASAVGSSDFDTIRIAQMYPTLAGFTSVRQSFHVNTKDLNTTSWNGFSISASQTVPAQPNSPTSYFFDYYMVHEVELTEMQLQSTGQSTAITRTPTDRLTNGGDSTDYEPSSSFQRMHM